ncbi:hypothetical protein H9P43_002767 [Blastocladiella emersonii ATCC 22665]|nr:hypothetical protein H9P43_002767 [Blastocladiella emersonii ATCC 22665]
MSEVPPPRTRSTGFGIVWPVAVPAMQLINALLVLSLLWAGTARAAEVDRRAPVQSGGIPAPAFWTGSEYPTDPSLKGIIKENTWTPFTACARDPYWSVHLDHPDAVARGATVDVLLTFYNVAVERDSFHALVWAGGKWVAQTEAASPVNDHCAPIYAQPSEIEARCAGNPNVPNLSVTLPAGTERFAFQPITGNKCTAGFYRFRIPAAPKFCASTAAPDYVVPRTTAGDVMKAALPVAQLTCNQIGADLAPVTSKNAADVAKAGIECIGASKQALIASWDGNSYDQAGLLLTLPSKAGKLPSVNAADPSVSLPPICKVRKAAEVEYGPITGTDSPIRVVRVLDGVDGASAAAVCTRRGYTLADLKTGDTFTTASGITYQALGSGGAAWIHSYDGDAYAGTCVALTVGGSGTQAGSVTVPAGGCTAKLGAVVCQTTAPVSAPMQRRSEL